VALEVRECTLPYSRLGAARLNLVGLAAATACAVAMASALAIMALFHGPMIPCQSELKRQWLPAGAERAWALRFISFGGTHRSRTANPVKGSVSNASACAGAAGKLASFTTTLTPWLCARVGWRGAVYVFGGTTLLFSAVWELIAAVRSNDMPRPHHRLCSSLTVDSTQVVSPL
jgi:hypothetical protein